MAELIFTCDACDSHKLEEIRLNMIGAFRVIWIDREDSELKYGPLSHSGGCVSRYQCKNCRQIIARNHKDLLASKMIKPGE
ncbi:hypothetical protein LCGC14_1962720 [marine sediment metagenome]|uniref:Uncharacterized protein n=1 Tax=marine sediment metagenome TaxID=412755 RepID=A0A0F9HSH6_9ZZZZ